MTIAEIAALIGLVETAVGTIQSAIADHEQSVKDQANLDQQAQIAAAKQRAEELRDIAQQLNAAWAELAPKS